MVSIPASFSDIIKKKICVIGVPLDLGQSRRGVDMGPSAVRVAGLEARLEAIGHTVEDAGNVSVVLAEQKTPGDPHARYLKEITANCTKHADLVLKTLEEGKVPLCIGGEHSMAVDGGMADFDHGRRGADCRRGKTMPRRLTNTQPGTGCSENFGSGSTPRAAKYQRNSCSSSGMLRMSST